LDKILVFSENYTLYNPNINAIRISPKSEEIKANYAALHNFSNSMGIL
jgi:hypothetical protein